MGPVVTNEKMMTKEAGQAKCGASVESKTSRRPMPNVSLRNSARSVSVKPRFSVSQAAD
jgi:hypothetical protein